MKSKYPILIPIKGNSVRCPNKNRILLAYTITYLQEIKRLEDAIVITDSLDLESYAKLLGVRTYFEVRIDNQDELLSCYNFLKKAEMREDYFFLMPVTHPFRTLSLCNLFEEKKEKYPNIDFIVSLNVFTDRSNFFVDIGDDNNPRFLYKKSRRGQDCKQYYMVDGALYLIKKSFLERVIQESNTNYHFWKGKFQSVINEAPFIDIDTIHDMERFNFIRKNIGNM
ncbi:hypothetical protein [Capnocytophaga felis]|uniref:CMP-N-acetylneuraminic acid synthetase n=1 Tax=Capnocytophaga felis TaxID=2267611 RepID=A0A5M4BD54_9FLAO|nr:hypothetical protein [Capnocytophaga felis]GET47026.1 hypothetical protein RCZ01_23280 [Capnocytophaga felis]GET49577.1 hypothetical protein RCZ02_24080 [Capnocytophaga felis]